MCIIVYKPQTQPMPNKSILETCFEQNPDGAGYMYAFEGKVQIRKGFMTFDKFYKALSKSIALTGEGVPYVLHFRISTQGGNRKDCTHPYPLSSNMANLRLLQASTNIGIAHNGIISLTSNSFNKTITYNDTMLFITDYLSLIIENENYYKNGRIIELISRLCESKLAILDRNGHCELIGKDWIKDNGIYYSNNTYEPCVLDFPYSYYNGAQFDIFESKYNEQKGVYDFDEYDCPMTYYGIEEYCECCANYYNCCNL